MNTRTTKRLRVEDLPPTYVDYYVAQAEGILERLRARDEAYRMDSQHRIYHRMPNGRSFPWSPSTDWRLGGPIIEREGITVRRARAGWEAARNGEAVAAAETPLLAAMRTRAILAFGPEIELEG